MSVGDIVVVVLLGCAVILAIISAQRSKGRCSGCGGCVQKSRCISVQNEDIENM